MLEALAVRQLGPGCRTSKTPSIPGPDL